jgi:hypothetical protein
MGCPYCQCGDECGRERALSLPRFSRSAKVFEAVADLYSKKPGVIDTDPLYVSQELVMLGHFDEKHSPTLTDVGHAQDLIRQVER